MGYIEILSSECRKTAHVRRRHNPAFINPDVSIV